MTRDYSHFKVEIINRQFITEDGRSFGSTAEISFFNEKGVNTGSASYGAIEAEEINRLIEKGSELRIDNCYVRDFSLAAYRRAHGMDRKEPVTINSLSAKDCFFESGSSTDFSFARFTGSEVNFEGSHFAGGKFLFNGCSSENCNIIFSGTLFHNGNLEFSGTSFGKGDFMFKNAVVGDGIKDFQDMHFGDGEVSFANTEFNSGELLFINSRFNSGHFNFKVARITGGKVDFHYSSFSEGDINFERAEFGDSRVDFRTVDFGTGRVNFNRCVFGNGEVNFEGASASSGKFQFKKAIMGTGPKFFNLMEMRDIDLSFERTDFGSGDVIFSESKFRTLSLRSCHLDHYLDLRLSSAYLLDISDTIVRDIIDIEPFDFPVDIKNIDMSGMRLPGKLYISWKNNRCREMITSYEGTNLRQKAEQFRILKENFNGTGKYEDEDRAYVLFKRYEAKSWMTEQKEKGKMHGIISYVPHGFQWLVFDKMGLFATSPGRVLASVFTLWLLFGSFYYIFEISGIGKTVSSVGNPDSLSPLLQSFYHSAITFFTIGYGDVYPMGYSRILSGVEGFTGVFMMSYFTVAFVRKVLR